MDETFDPNLVHAIFKLIWRRKALERERNEISETLDPEGGPGTSKKNRPTSANANAVKLSCELLRVFITEAIQRAAAVAEAEGVSQIEEEADIGEFATIVNQNCADRELIIRWKFS